MKAGWELTALGALFKTVTGNTPPKSDARYYGQAVPLVKPPELTDGPVFDAEDGLSLEGAKLARIAPAGSVLVSCIGNLGKIGLAEQDLAFNQQINAIYPMPTRALPRFMFYQALSPQFRRQLEALATGTTVSIVNKSRFNSISIALPPLAEQQRIVAILDEACEGLDRARINAEANLQNARELFESALGAGLARDAGGWRTAELEDLVEPDCTLSYGIVQPGEEYAGGLPIVRPTDLGEREIGLSGLKRIDPAIASGYARTSLKGREILLCVRGSTGVVAMASEELAGANVTRGIVPIRFNPKLLKQRLGYFQFLSGPVQSQIRAGTYGAALMQINIRDLRLIKMLVPPLDQQDTVLERLENLSEQIDRTVLHYQLKLQQIIDLRQSLMHKAFAGELT